MVACWIWSALKFKRWFVDVLFLDKGALKRERVEILTDRNPLAVFAPLFFRFVPIFGLVSRSGAMDCIDVWRRCVG